MDNQVKFKSVDEYMSSVPEGAREMMEEIRKTVKDIAPDALELISYNMPAFKYKGRVLLYYMAHRAHIGFYPADATVIAVFKDDLVKYHTSKGTVQFPLDKKLPLGLIKKIVQYRVKVNLEKAAKK